VGQLSTVGTEHSGLTIAPLDVVNSLATRREGAACPDQAGVTEPLISKAENFAERPKTMTALQLRLPPSRPVRQAMPVPIAVEVRV
jgi:hypothetical protein